MKEQRAEVQLGDKSIRPAHLLVNYFVSTAASASEDEVRASLRGIARKLATEQVSDLTDQQVDEELNHWTTKGLLQKDQRGLLTVPRRLRHYYIGVSKNVNEELDTVSLRVLLDAVDTASTSKPERVPS